jgi:hypothetical protein
VCEGFVEVDFGCAVRERVSRNFDWKAGALVSTLPTAQADRPCQLAGQF